MSKLIKVNKKNKHLVEVVINRPEKLNAMTKPKNYLKIRI